METAVIFALKKTEEKNLPIKIFLQKKNEGLSLHSHESFELSYIAEGTFDHILESGEKITLKKGHLCIIAPGERHKCALGSDDSIVINIQIEKSLFTSTFMSFLSDAAVIGDFFVNTVLGLPSVRNSIAIAAKPGDYCDSLVDRLCSEYIKNDSYALLKIRSLLILFFAEILQSAPEHASSFSPKIQRIVSYIAHKPDRASLAETADHFNMHPNYLSALIKKETGFSFAEISGRIRLTQACQMLKEKRLSTEEIATLLGYSDGESFSAMFRRKMGVSPAKYRQGE